MSVSLPSQQLVGDSDVEVPPGGVCWWAPGGRKPAKGTSAVAQAYVELREQILSGELAPGTPLSEYQLAKALAVSRTPVREALGRLQSAGLVRNVPQRGMFVRELGARDVVEILEIREQLECLSVRRVAEHGVPEATLDHWVQQTERCVELLREGKAIETLVLGCQLHDELVSLAGNGRLTEILSQLGDQIRLLNSVGIRVPGRPEAAVHEHKHLIAMLRKQDVAAAVCAMRDHLRNEGQILLKALLPAGAFPGG